MKNYGLTKHQIDFTMKKVELNMNYLKSNGCQIDNKIIPYADFVSNSYNNSDRYIAELQHRAWSVYDYANELGLKNIFITLTLPSEWHPKKTLKNGKLVNNPRFRGLTFITSINGYDFLNAHVKQNIPFIEPILDFSKTVDKYTPKNASKELSNMFKKIRDDRSYKSILKDDRVYFRVTEPHKDGTPHLHISLFVPHDRYEKIVKAVKRLFPAPASKVETDIKSPVSYLMKYVLKTLDDLRENSEDITNLTLWYLYHGISRFYTSRTFAPLEVYRKLGGMYSLIDLTKDYQRNDIQVYTCTTTKKILYIENEFGTIYTQKPVNFFDKQDNADEVPYLESEYEPLSTKDMSRYEKMTINNKVFYVEHTKLKAPPKYTKKPYQMRDTQLLHYFNNIDIDTVDMNHYNYTYKLIMERGLLSPTMLSPTNLIQSKEVF